MCFPATCFSIEIVFDRWVVIDLQVSLIAFGSIASRLKEDLRLDEVIPARPSLLGLMAARASAFLRETLVAVSIPLPKKQGNRLEKTTSQATSGLA